MKNFLIILKRYALAPIRVKTINTQKVLGSSQFQLRKGLVVEDVVFCLCAFAVSLCIIAPITEWLYAQNFVERTGISVFIFI